MTQQGALDPASRRRRVVMPLVILVVAIGIGLWFPGQTGSDGDIEQRLRNTLSSQCGPTMTPPVVQWALPIVQSTFEAAASRWCERGIDLASVTITQKDTGDGGRSITLHSPDGDSIHLLLTIESDGTPLVSSISLDPAGT